MRKQMWISRGQKKQDGATDTEQLINICNYLRKRYRIVPHREWFLLFDDDERLISIVDSVMQYQVELASIIRNPDILWSDKYGTWIIEVDGAVHDRKTEKTRMRNEMFLNNNIKLIVINLANLKETKTNIYHYIDSRILEEIKK